MTKDEEIRSLKETVKLYRFDYLTGLKQRRDFDHDLRKKWHAEHDFFLVYYDVNNLHRMNREKGFAEGDRLIRQVASDIQYQSVPHQTYRYSGDEFYAICCQEPTEEVDNATRVLDFSSKYVSVDAIMKALDELMVTSKAVHKTRREED